MFTRLYKSIANVQNRLSANEITALRLQCNYIQTRHRLLIKSLNRQKSSQVRTLNQRLIQILKLKMKDQIFSETKAIMVQYGYT